MRIGELARRTGLSVHTLRYYERIGLLPAPPRGESTHQRDYDAAVLPWIDFLQRLKTTGMPIRERLRYAALRADGAETAPARRLLLVRHRDEVRVRVAELQAALAVLDAKIAGYGENAMEQNHDGTDPLPGGPRRSRRD
jgi:DNA-binding transcriptional MerR regulator